MKTWYCLLIIILLTGCRGTKFSYATDQDVDASLGVLTPIKIDDTYQLYLRQVIKTYDSAAKMYVPVNGQLDTRNNKKNVLIEVEYLFVSADHKKVLVITNLPDSYKKFYNSPDKAADLSPAAPVTKLDIWYFRQFRFGEIINNTAFEFFNIEDQAGVNHTWNISQADNGNTIKLNSISIKDNYGEEVRDIDAAFALEMIFKKVDAFQFIFKNNAGKRMKTTDVDEFPLPNNTFYIAGGPHAKRILFRFTQPINGDKSNVIFYQERIYAAPR